MYRLPVTKSMSWGYNIQQVTIINNIIYLEVAKTLKVLITVKIILTMCDDRC